MSTSPSVKRPDSLLHYFSMTGEQPPSPKRIRAADESEDLNQKRIRSVQVLAAQVQQTQAAAVQVVKASSLSHLNVSGSWGGSTGLIDSKVVFCRLCKKHDKRLFNCSIWNTKPCKRIRLQSITAHEQCAAHRDSVSLEALLSAHGSIAGAVHPPVPSQGMEQAFSCLYFLCKQRIPHTTNYEPLLDLAGLLDHHHVCFQHCNVHAYVIV